LSCCRRLKVWLVSLGPLSCILRTVVLTFEEENISVNHVTYVVQTKVAVQRANDSL